jgi:hypothetical protein
MTERPKFGAGSMSTEKKEPKQEIKEEKTEETPEPSSEETVDEATTPAPSKPRFGAGSMSTKKQEPKQEEATKDSSEQTVEETATPVSSAPKSFGAGTDASAGEKKHSSIGDIFKNQGVSFWIVSYVASFLIYSYLDRSFGAFKTMNLLLFPFTLILFAQLQVFLTGSMNGLAHWIAPEFKAHGTFTSAFTAILWYASKLGFYYLVWGYSYFLGIIGIIMIFVTNKKINR